MEDLLNTIQIGKKDHILQDTFIQIPITFLDNFEDKRFKRYLEKTKDLISQFLNEEVIEEKEANIKTINFSNHFRNCILADAHTTANNDDFRKTAVEIVKTASTLTEEKLKKLYQEKQQNP